MKLSSMNAASLLVGVVLGIAFIFVPVQNTPPKGQAPPLCAGQNVVIFVPGEKKTGFPLVNKTVIYGDNCNPGGDPVAKSKAAADFIAGFLLGVILIQAVSRGFHNNSSKKT